MNLKSGWIFYPVVSIGLVLPVPLILLVKSKLKDPHLIRDLILQGKRLNGADAKLYGFVDCTCEPEDVISTGYSKAQMLANFGANKLVYGDLKKNIYCDLLKAFNEGNEHPLSFRAAL